MFVQIGNEAVNRDHIVAVSFLDSETVRVVTVAGQATFTGDNCRAFRHWWRTCARVIQPKPAYVRIEVNGGAAEVIECPTWVSVEIIDRDQRETEEENVATKAYAGVH